ncbi:hypothetical protein ACEUZ9_000315 [Paracoccus litorisediminis]|uniref:hypothetical protein n=1 Tax=Paracoccus litorisediminis TaxID=2006130 RepID=UPI00372D8B9F
MVESLCISRTNSKDENRNAAIFVRRHDLGGVDYDMLLTFPARLAPAIEGHHTGIFFRRDGEFPAAEAKHPLVIRQIRDRNPMQAKFDLEIGGEHAVFLNEGAVRMLQHHTKVEFPDGAPDWDLCHIQTMEDEITGQERKLAAMREALDTYRGIYEARRSETAQVEMSA